MQGVKVWRFFRVVFSKKYYPTLACRKAIELKKGAHLLIGVCFFYFGFELVFGVLGMREMENGGLLRPPIKCRVPLLSKNTAQG